MSSYRDSEPDILKRRHNYILSTKKTIIVFSSLSKLFDQAGGGHLGRLKSPKEALKSLDARGIFIFIVVATNLTHSCGNEGDIFKYFSTST